MLVVLGNDLLRALPQAEKRVTHNISPFAAEREMEWIKGLIHWELRSVRESPGSWTCREGAQTTMKSGSLKFVQNSVPLRQVHSYLLGHLLVLD